ncbi:hypothetical protein BH10ACI3_BH10ACI3_03900 [soil metagenome]
MAMRFAFALIFVHCFSGIIWSQTSTAYIPQDPMNSIAADLAKITRSVSTLSAQMKIFVDKFEKVGGLTFTEKQQKLILGMELLTRTEQRVTVLQKAQIDLVEKQNEVKNKLTQVENDLRPRNVENSVVYAGTTETDELREARRVKLQSERMNLNALLTQLQSNAAETTDALRDAQSLAYRLRRTFLPQVEKELYDQ